MGITFGAICNECGTKFEVSEGSGMIAMPLHCDRCGKEWWWEFGPEGPFWKEPRNQTCECGGTFTTEADPRCPNCSSRDFGPDAKGTHIMYD